MKQIVVYVDQGVSGKTLFHTVKSLQQETKAPLKRLDAAALCSTEWEKETALLVIPGGNDVYYDSLLKEEGNNKIRSFVEENGGGYLGLCAGAYFAARKIEFEKGAHQQICAERSLGFYPGVARGSAYGVGKYVPDSDKGAQVAQLSWNGERCMTYFNGGCLFDDPSSFSNVEVLSRYINLEGKPAAIVLCKCGKGKAILSGAHIEMSASYLAHIDPKIENVDLEQGEKVRRILFKDVLKQLV